MQLSKLNGLLVELYQAQLTEKQAWLADLSLTLFNSIGMILALIMMSHTDLPPRWPFISSSLVGFLLTAILLWNYRSTSRKLTNTIFILNTSSVILALAIAGSAFEGTVPLWMPFRPAQLGSLMVALLSPTFVLGLLALISHAGVPLIIYFSYSPEIKLLIPHGEVVATWAYGLAAFFLLIFRFYRMLHDEKYKALLSEKIAIEAVARNFLHIRDLMNTPLQTLELALEMLRKKVDDEEQFLRCKRALTDLQKLNEILKKHEKELEN